MEDIIRKIKALIAKAASTNSEAEAMACAAKAQELMAKYNLTEAQVSSEAIGELPKNKRISDQWRRWIAVCTARLFNCVLVISYFEREFKNGGRGYDKCWSFVGRQGDCVTADLMTDYFIGAVVRLANEHSKEVQGGQQEWRMFAKACALRLSQRIYEMAEKSADHQVLAIVEKHMEENMNITNGRRSKAITLSGSSARAGFDQANAVGLNLQATSDSHGNLQIGQTLQIGRA